jgi:hypothetical protein
VFGGGNRSSASNGGKSRSTDSRSSGFESQTERRDSQRD